MALGMVGKKLGMSRVFGEDGGSIPVTVLDVSTNHITQVKTKDCDGYDSVQVTIGSRRPNRVKKPTAGHYAKAKVQPGIGLWEFRVDDAADSELELQPGGSVPIEIFEAGQRVDVQGTTIGRGFAGPVRRWGFGGGRASHGASLTHRAHGSTGHCQEPGRVFPGKKMAGQMGNVRRTQQNLEIVKVDPDRRVLLVKGSVPGPRGCAVVISPSVKAKKT